MDENVLEPHRRSQVVSAALSAFLCFNCPCENDTMQQVQNSMPCQPARPTVARKPGDHWVWDTLWLNCEIFADRTVVPHHRNKMQNIPHPDPGSKPCYHAEILGQRPVLTRKTFCHKVCLPAGILGRTFSVRSAEPFCCCSSIRSAIQCGNGRVSLTLTSREPTRNFTPVTDVLLYISAVGMQLVRKITVGEPARCKDGIPHLV